MLTPPYRPDPQPRSQTWRGLESRPPHNTGKKCCDHLARQLLLDWLVQVSLWPRSGPAGRPGLPGAGLILAGSCRSELPALGQAPEQVPAGLSFHPQPAGGCPGHRVTEGGRSAEEEPSKGSFQLWRLREGRVLQVHLASVGLPFTRGEVLSGHQHSPKLLCRAAAGSAPRGQGRRGGRVRSGGWGPQGCQVPVYRTSSCT